MPGIASLQGLQQQRHVSHHEARWLNLLAEYQYRVVLIPGRTNPADFLTRKRGPGSAPHTGCDESDSALELFTVTGAPPASAFVAAGPDAESPLFLHADFAAAVRAALLSDPVLGPLAAAAQAQDPSAACPSHCAFVCRDGLLYRCGRRYDRLCVPATGALRAQVLHELHAAPLGGHFGRDKTLALRPWCAARCGGHWSGLPVEVEEYVRTCPTYQRVKADRLQPAGLPYPLPVPTRRGVCISLDFLEFCPSPAPATVFCRCTSASRQGECGWSRPSRPHSRDGGAHEHVRQPHVASVFRDVGLPDVLVSDRDTRFTGAFWAGLHAALGASLIFGLPTITTPPVR